ncbi:hypothetical protein Q2T42_30565 [Leptolyngbya boryana CZ1]|uniref:Tyr recombinase domain-containing protein n=1 Tax=Leptolyngbya boryana CZ1 TaxID=3060204 RepID=A0AA97ATY9_LEPBY|nr:hypothetical protein [Leptolyngbya boryana]WNZ46135.1 hypothetical protein Q2T42_30565 [Leptolyngbya boryana CZ1]
MAKISTDEQVERINDRLKEAGTPVRVRLNGKVLGIRATLPMKSGQGKKQQDLRLGIPATSDGFKEVERRANQLGKEISTNTFSWANWERDRMPKPDEIPVSMWVEKFKGDYMQFHRLKEATWHDNWGATFRKLPQDEPLSEAVVLAVALSTAPDSCIRERTCQRLQALCDFAKLKIDLKPYKGTYGQGSEEPRDIPSDELIVEWRDRIQNDQWQWVYGMLATFGLRPHEVFACEFVDSLTIKIREEMQVREGSARTKTGFHIARAFYPEWAEDWNLIKVNRPNVSGKTPRVYGQRVSRQFSRYQIPFVPYDLRHAYAIRGSVVEKYPSVLMAEMMGHSESVHTATYNRWISNSTSQAAYDTWRKGRGS